MPGDDQPPNLRRLAAFTLLTKGAMWMASAAWLLSGDRHVVAGSQTVAADATAVATPLQLQGTPANPSGDPAAEVLAPIGGSDEPVSVPTQLAATSSPGVFALAVAKQLWAGDPDTDAAGFRVLDRTDPGLTDTELDEVSAAVDAILASRIRADVASVNVAESTGLDDALSVSVTGNAAAARLTLRVRCTADCVLVGVAA